MPMKLKNVVCFGAIIFKVQTRFFVGLIIFQTTSSIFCFMKELALVDPCALNLKL